MENYYCEYCGTKTSNVVGLTSGMCRLHPNGPNKGHHSLYQGSEKSQYTCKYCGTKASSIVGLTGSTCRNYPNGANKGRHVPAL